MPSSKAFPEPGHMPGVGRLTLSRVLVWDAYYFIGILLKGVAH